MPIYTKRKYVQLESKWKDLELPKEDQSVVKILKNRGNHLHEVITASGEIYLVSMRAKFRNTIFVKNGSYVLVEPIAGGKKVKGEIVQILNTTSIKNYKQNHVWPPEFEEAIEERNTNESTNESNDDDLFVNTNYKGRAVTYFTDDSSDSDDSDSYDSDSDDSDSDDSDKNEERK